MSRDLVHAICRALPGAQYTDSWGDRHEAWRIGDKMFVCFSTTVEGISVKTDSVEMAEMLIDAGVGIKAPYFHRSWVNLPYDAGEAELRHRIATSYRLMRESLTRKAQAALPAYVD